ncbi:MAG TPA: CRTAC1 family protein [Pirellulales bacterium]|nr:CRTAC1 family protein [Pirellulales bacterium]
MHRFITPIAALAIVGMLYYLSQPPKLREAEAAALAGRFAFEKRPLAEPPGYEQKTVRQVHPSLEHLSGQISFVGAAAALGDLDGDGLANDLLLVDPRIDQVIVAPVPGTGERYSPFALHPSPLAYDVTTTAPMGTVIGDFNEDGSADVLTYYWGRSPVMFLRRTDGGDGAAVPSATAFDPVELVDPVQRWYTSTCTQADLDGDGHVDLVLGNYFADHARILDARGDGQEEMPDSFSRAFNGGRNRLLLSQLGRRLIGAALFREADDVLAHDVACGWTFAQAAVDLDGDLLPEIYFVQDWGPDRLLHNRSEPGRLRFELLAGERTATIPMSKVLGCDTFNGMGIDCGDLNGDGWPDLFVSNITSAYGLHESNFLFLSTGEIDRMRAGIAPYRDVSEPWGIARSGWSWEAKLADFDNDGTLEAIQATGFLKGAADRFADYQETAVANDRMIRDPHVWPHMQPGDNVAGDDTNPFFVRAADGRYYDVGPHIGFDQPLNSRGIAIADVDGDGLLDLVLANQWRASYFFRNTAPNAGQFLGLCLRLPLGAGPSRPFAVHEGHPSAMGGPTRPALGASASVQLPDGRKLAAQVDGGNGHSGKRSPDVHFGLGRIEAPQKLRVELRWRDSAGEVQEATLRLSPGWHTVILGKPQVEDNAT